ncbi:MAG: fibronectin type III domain-containing protein [bacterium]|nr:fibronectin type III domain-containing protein [bacterium]
MKYFLFTLITIIIFACAPRYSKPIQAATFSSAYLRLERQAVSVNPGSVLVVAAASETVNENQVSLEIPVGWSISTAATSYTVSTTNLPEGVYAWPGISTAANLSGRTLTFPSSDLITGRKYGFYITAGLNSNPETAGLYSWQLSTGVSGSVTNSQVLSTTINGNDQIQVTGTVLPKSSSFQASLALVAGNSHPSQDNELEYELTYGSDLNHTTPLQLRAAWTEGTISGASAPTVTVVTYINGSATTAYNNTPPVIDTINSVITWSITALPADTQNQKVRFKLKTTNSYTDTKTVSFNVTGMISQPATTAESVVSHQYQFKSPPTASVLPIPSPSPPVALEIPGFSITNVTLSTISPNSALISVGTNDSSVISIQYGESSRNLNQLINGSTQALRNKILLDGLTNNTFYFFRVIAVNVNGQKIYSDIYTFKTAQSSSSGEITPNQSIVNTDSSSIPLFNPSNISQNKELIIPIGQLLKTTFYFDNYEGIKSVILEMTNEYEDSQRIYATRLTALQDGSYTGEIPTPERSGWYRIYLIITDLSGNLTRQLLHRLYSSDPLTILDANTKKPLENVQVLIYQYSNTLQLYELLTPKTFIDSNPSYSNSEGQVNVALPKGKYQIDTSRIGYKDTTIHFVIGNSEAENYPTIYLEPSQFSLSDIAHFVTLASIRITNSVDKTAQHLHASSTFYLFISSITLLLFGLQLLRTLTTKSFYSLLDIPSYITFQIISLLRQQRSQKWTISGQIHNQAANKGVHRATITFFDPVNKTVIGTAQTDKNGYYHYLLNVKTAQYMVNEEGFHPKQGEVSFEKHRRQPVITNLEKVASSVSSIKNTASSLVTRLFNVSFEALLVVTTILHLVLTPNFDVTRSLPLLAISTATIFLWILNTYAQKKYYIPN